MSPGSLARTRPPTHFSRVGGGGGSTQPPSETLASPTASTVSHTVTLPLPLLLYPYTTLHTRQAWLTARMPPGTTDLIAAANPNPNPNPNPDPKPKPKPKPNPYPGPNPNSNQAQLFEARALLLSRGGAAAALGLLPRDAFTLLEKHTVPGLLTRTLTLTLALALTLTLTLTPTLTPTPAREAHGTRPPNPNPDPNPSPNPNPNPNLNPDPNPNPC